jgi:ubiquinone/menaquinone biosynthesis C-methylase UbiE
MSAFDMLTPYTPLYSAFYDYYIAPSILELSRIDFQENFVNMVGSNCRLLDVGCGGGHQAIDIVQRRPDIHITGLDLSPEQIKRAQKRARKLGLEKQVQFLEGTSLDLPFSNEDFDHVYSIGSIKHWTDKKKGLSECLRVLKPGGNLYLLEADRSCYYEDVMSWLKTTRIPFPLKPIFKMFFFTYVSGQSIDLYDANELWNFLPLVNKKGAYRVPKNPVLVMHGKKQ